MGVWDEEKIVPNSHLGPDDLAPKLCHLGRHMKQVSVRVGSKYKGHDRRRVVAGNQPRELVELCSPLPPRPVSEPRGKLRWTLPLQCLTSRVWPLEVDRQPRETTEVAPDGPPA